jgi:hypothetical protein
VKPHPVAVPGVVSGLDGRVWRKREIRPVSMNPEIATTPGMWSMITKVGPRLPYEGHRSIVAEWKHDRPQNLATVGERGGG